MKEEFQKLEALFKSVFLIIDEGLVKVVCASIIANRLPFDPFWMFLVGPSSSGKSEMIMSLTKTFGIVPISSLTPHTFISGLKRPGKETSMLFKISEQYGRQGIMTFKDFTSIITMHHEDRKEIMGQLREIFDGSLNRSFGTGDDIKWTGKVGMVSAVTDAIYRERQMYAKMGERFTMYKFITPDRKDVLRYANDEKMEQKQEDREKLKDAVANFLDKVVGTPVTIPKVPKFMEDEIIDLAEFTTRARSSVDRDYYSQSKEIEYVYDPEGPTRFADQLKTIYKALVILNGGALQDLDQRIIYKIALDSIDQRCRRALQAAAKYTTITTPGLAILINLPTTSTRRILEDLNALGVLIRIKTGREDHWKIKDEYRPLIQKVDQIKFEDKILDETYQPEEGGPVQDVVEHLKIDPEDLGEQEMFDNF